jgi:predicted enzyme related to lactoylglutathione lyase
VASDEHLLPTLARSQHPCDDVWSAAKDSHTMDDPTLNLLVLYSADVARAVAFYSALGLAFSRHQHGSGPEHDAAELGDLVFEIYPARPQQGPAGVRIGFRVVQLDACVAALAETGAQVISAPRPSPWGRRAVVADPDGNRVELTERAAGDEA